MSMKKALIYLACIAAAAAAQTALRMNGVILGGLPIVALYGLAIMASRLACKVGENKKASPAISIQEEQQEVEEPKQQKQRRAELAAFIFSVALVLCICFLGYHISTLTSKNKALQAEINELSSENSRLRAQVEELQAPAEATFSNWTTWKKLNEAGSIKLSYDEWLSIIRPTKFSEP